VSTLVLQVVASRREPGMGLLHPTTQGPVL
jgi:hypothetical protein